MTWQQAIIGAILILQTLYIVMGVAQHKDDKPGSAQRRAINIWFTVGIVVGFALTYAEVLHSAGFW